METSQVLWTPPDDEKIVSMVAYRDAIMIATDRRIYVYGPEDVVKLIRLKGDFPE